MTTGVPPRLLDMYSKANPESSKNIDLGSTYGSCPNTAAFDHNGQKIRWWFEIFLVFTPSWARFPF